MGSNRRLILACVFILISVSVSAFPLIPETYSGFAYINGKPASTGTEIKVVSGGGVEFTTKVINDAGLYAMDVLFDDVETANVKEGASVGEALTWYVGGLKASQPAPGSDSANSGGVNVNFNVLAGSSGSSCSDGVRNNGEEGVDCGGPCPACGKGKTSTTLQQGSNKETAPSGSPAKSSSGFGVKPLPASCSDGVRNSGEEGVDCGGSCNPCGGGSSTLLWVAGGAVFLVVFGFVALAALFFFINSKRKGG